MKTNNLNKALLSFLESFEEVFDRDWSYTKEMLGIYDDSEEQKKFVQEIELESIYIIAPDGTFINPKVEDEIEDWGNRGKLLKDYRNLKEIIDESYNDLPYITAKDDG